MASVLLLAGCSSSSGAVDLGVSEFATKVAEAGVITLDVRTPGEYMGGFIEGAKTSISKAETLKTKSQF